MKRLPCAKMRGITGRFPREILNADLMGPVGVKFYREVKYFILVMDDYSWRIFPFYLKDKSEAAPSFIDFIKLCQNEPGDDIQTLHTDRGFKWIGKEFNNNLYNGVWNTTFNSRGSAQLNPVPERSIQTVVTKATTLLEDAKLPKTFGISQCRQQSISIIYCLQLRYQKVWLLCNDGIKPDEETVANI